MKDSTVVMIVVDVLMDGVSVKLMSSLLSDSVKVALLVVVDVLLLLNVLKLVVSAVIVLTVLVSAAGESSVVFVVKVESVVLLLSGNDKVSSMLLLSVPMFVSAVVISPLTVVSVMVAELSLLILLSSRVFDGKLSEETIEEVDGVIDTSEVDS